MVAMTGAAAEPDTTYAADARQALTAALERDLGLDPQEYLRQVDLAQRLHGFATELRQRFPGAVTGEWLDRQGRAVVALQHDSAAAREAAQRAGILAVDATATPELPTVRADSVRQVLMDAVANSGGDQAAGGDPFYAENTNCSWAFNAADSSGDPVVLTAGHCNPTAVDGEKVQTFAMPPGPTRGTATGEFDKTVNDGRRDYAIVRIREEVKGSFDNSLVRTANGTLSITGVGIPVVGAPVCKSGATTGFTCGVITQLDQPDPQRPPTRFMHSAFTLPGDSGGPLVSGTLAMGVVSRGGFIDFGKPIRFPTNKPEKMPSIDVPDIPLADEIKQLLVDIADIVDTRSLLQQLGPLVDQLVRAVPSIVMIAQSAVDVLAENPGLQLRTE